MGLASLALNIGVLYNFLYSILLFNDILGLDFIGLALSRPQVGLHAAALDARLAGVAALSGLSQLWASLSLSAHLHPHVLHHSYDRVYL
jgi:hypothetical protein